MQALRILQLCNKPPFPAIDGGCLAMLRSAEGLMDAGCTVKILSVATAKHPWNPSAADPDFLRKTNADSVFIDTSVKWLPAFLSLFKSGSYNLERFYSLSFEARLIEILAAQKFDIVQLESLYMSPYISAIRRMSEAKIVLRAHNTESAIWKKYADTETDVLKKTWYRDLAAKLEKHEISTVKSVDAIVPITTQDAERLKTLGATVPLHVSTFAMRNPRETTNAVAQPLSVFHIGAMDWKPNADGIDWLIKNVWPLVIQRIPEAQLHLAGKGMQSKEHYQGSNIFVHGEVSDAHEFMQKYQVMAVPLFSGGGVKIKVIEGMFNHKPIVTTPIGAEGLAVKNNEEILITEKPEDFARALCQLLEDPAQAEQMGANAHKTAMENHELSRVTGKLCDFYRTICAS